MQSFRDLFELYISHDSKSSLQKIEDAIKEKCENFKFYPLENFDLVYLYRQARIFNLQSELQINLNSDYYKYKQEKIIKLLSIVFFKINDVTKQMFEYNDSSNKFTFENFLCFLAIYSLENQRFQYEIIRMMVELFDSQSIKLFAQYHSALLIEDNKPVEEIYSILLSTYFEYEQIDDVMTHLLCLMKSNLIYTNEQNREKFTNLSNFVNYIDHCLTHKSKCFYLVANECSNNFKNSAFFDFSIVSLQYYKIIETEIKNKLLLPCARKINGPEHSFGGKFYIRKNEEKFNFLSLEKIHNISSYACDYVSSNKKYDEFFNSLFKECKSNILYLQFFRDITSENFRNKYRNPPAHTEPLNGEALDEMITIFESFIVNLSKLKTDELDEPQRPKIIDFILKTPTISG